MSSTPPLAFLDTETTHLSAELGEVWEVAIIRRETVPQSDSTYEPEGEHVWQFRPRDLSTATPEALRIGRYYERFAVPDDCGAAYTAGGDIDPMTRADAITEITVMLDGAVIIGSNPGFDDRHLRKLLDLRDEQPWHYRPIDIATLAAGYQYGMASTLRNVGGKTWNGDLPHLPFSSRGLSRWVGVEPPGDGVAHTALGDARWCKSVFDAITSGGAQ